MKNINLSKILFSTVALSLLMTSCHFFQNEKSNKKQAYQLLLCGNEASISKIVKTTIGQTTIEQDGYVLILDFTSSTKEKTVKKLKDLYYKNQVNAVHILKVKPKSLFKNSDIIAIENATILYLIGDKGRAYKNIVTNTKLKNMLFKAKDNGSLIVGGTLEISKLFGKYSFHKQYDSATGVTKVRKLKGLMLINNAAIDRLAFFKQYKGGIKKDVNKDKFSFIGIGNKSLLLVGEEQGWVIDDSKVGLLPPNRSLIYFHKGDAFSIHPPTR